MSRVSLTLLGGFEARSGSRVLSLPRLRSSLGLRAYEVQCHRQLGQLSARAGESEGARRHLATALSLYREMGMIRWIEPTTALLERLDQ